MTYTNIDFITIEDLNDANIIAEYDVIADELADDIAEMLAEDIPMHTEQLVSLTDLIDDMVEEGASDEDIALIQMEFAAIEDHVGSMELAVQSPGQ